jgi:predicted dehydrogenase
MEVYGESKTMLEFENNKTAVCEASWLKPADFQFYTYTRIEGTDNFIEFDGEKIINNDIWNIKNQFFSLDGYYNQINQFFKFLLNQGKGISGIVGREAVKMCLAAIKSASNKGKKIFLNDLD